MQAVLLVVDEVESNKRSAWLEINIMADPKGVTGTWVWHTHTEGGGLRSHSSLLLLF